MIRHSKLHGEKLEHREGGNHGKVTVSAEAEQVGSNDSTGFEDKKREGGDQRTKVLGVPADAQKTTRDDGHRKENNGWGGVSGFQKKGDSAGWICDTQKL